MNGQRKRGFAALNPEQQRAIARKGGKAAHGKGTAHEFSPEEARRAGQLGGKAVSMNRAHMAAIGRKGGQRTVQKAVSARPVSPSHNELLEAEVRQTRANVSSSSVVERLRADHQRVNGLFHQYEFDDLVPAKRTVVLQQLCQELLRHGTFEEEMVYPIVRLELPEGNQQLVHDSIRAHERIKELVRRLEGRPSDDPSVNDLVKELQKCVQEHVQKEEQELLPRIEEGAHRELPQLNQPMHFNSQETHQSIVDESVEDTSSVHH